MIKIVRNESEAGVSIKNNRLLMLLEELSVSLLIFRLTKDTEPSCLPHGSSLAKRTTKS